MPFCTATRVAIMAMAKRFALATRGRWGDLDYEDNIACLRTACERFDFVDPARLAVAGGSYGGYMAFWIATRHPEFKAAVVDRSLINRTSFAGDIGFLLDRVEFDKQPLWAARERYIERSPITYVAEMQVPTLVVHSAQDHRCPIDQGEQLYLSLKRLGVPSEFVRFPNELTTLPVAVARGTGSSGSITILAVVSAVGVTIQPQQSLAETVAANIT